MIPTPLVLDVVCAELTGDEQHAVNQLQWRLSESLPFLLARQAYYDGEQPMRTLGIAVPPQLAMLRTASGWPGVVVDSLEEKLDVEGFRFPASIDADDALWDIWTANGMDQESELAHLDALIFGRGFAMAGTAEEQGAPPLLTIESPMNMAATFDSRTRRVTEALQVYEFWGDQAAALYLPDQTIHLIRQQGRAWQIRERDQHQLGVTPVVMLSNRQRTFDRYGRSEISPEIMSWTDAACRTLLGMEIAREFFGSPQRYVLGASESAFVNQDGTPTDAWETYIGRMLALERDEDGQVPTVGTFAAANPQPFLEIVQALARLVSAKTGLPPHLLGFVADNPASAEGIRSAEARLDKRARRKQRCFEGSWRDLMKLALMISNGGELPADAHKLDVLWAPPETPTVAATSSAILQQVQAGALPGDSEVALERLGYSAVERARIAADRKRAAGSDALVQIADALNAGRLRTQLTAEAQAAESPAAAGAAAAAAPAPAAPAGR